MATPSVATIRVAAAAVARAEEEVGNDNGEVVIVWPVVIEEVIEGVVEEVVTVPAFQAQSTTHRLLRFPHRPRTPLWPQLQRMVML